MNFISTLFDKIFSVDEMVEPKFNNELEPVMGWQTYIKQISLFEQDNTNYIDVDLVGLPAWASLTLVAIRNQLRVNTGAHPSMDMLRVHYLNSIAPNTNGWEEKLAELVVSYEKDLMAIA